MSSRSRLCVFFLSVLGLGWASVGWAESNRSVSVRSVRLIQAEDGMTVNLKVAAPKEHNCHEVELLVRIARDDDGSLETLLADLSRLDTQWLQTAFGEVGDEIVQMAPTELSPIRPDTQVAIQEYRDRLYLRFRLSQTIAAGQNIAVSIGPLAYEDQDEEDPLRASAVAIGHAVSPLGIADFDTLVESGPVGLLVLLRSVGLEGDVATRRVRIQALRDQEGFQSALEKSLRSELLNGRNAQRNELATAVRLRVFSLLDGSAFGRFVPRVLASSHRAGLATLLNDILEKLQADDPFSWESLAFLVPADSLADPVVAVLGAGVEDMKPDDVVTLLDSMQAHQKAHPKATHMLMEAAGAGWLNGAADWSDSTLKRVVGVLESRQVSSAVVGFFGESMWDRLGRLFPGDQLFQMAKKMIGKSVPVQLVRAMGDSDPARREFAFDLVLERYAVARDVVTSELARLGHSLAQVESPEDATDLGVKEWPLTLQGLYLSPLALPYVEEAERVLYLRRMGKQGSCYEPLRRGRTEVHARLAYPPGLWSRCRAEGAHELLQSGKTDAAVALLESALQDAGDDPEVQRWEMPVMLGKARQLIADGQSLEARRLLGRIDPENRHGDVRSLLTHIDSIREPTVERSQKHALLLQVFAILLMVLGVGAAAALWFASRRDIRFVNDLSEETPVAFGHGGRSYLVTDHALLIRRGMARRLIPWAEIRAVCRVPPSTGLGEGLLFWHMSGDGFLVSVGRLKESGAFVDAVNRYLTEMSVPLVEAETMDEEATAENLYMMRMLVKRDRLRGVCQAIAAGVGCLASVFTLFMATDTVLLSPSQIVQGVAIGLGSCLTLLSAIEILIPLSRG